MSTAPGLPNLDLLRAARSFLFVPGSRPDRFATAAAAGADLVVLDLEDAVAPQDKSAARNHVASWLSAGHQAIVRINAAGTEWFEHDLKSIRAHASAVMVPKSDSLTVLEAVDEHAPGVPIIALIETAEGILSSPSLLRARHVVRAAFGSIDLAAELGVSPDDHEALRWARSHLVAASAAAGVAPPVDGVTTSIGQTSVLQGDCEWSVRLGFSGKLCIHPVQVPLVHQYFSPTADDIQWASRVIEASRAAAVTALDGHMVDAPVIARARTILDRTGPSTPSPSTHRKAEK